MRSLLAALLLLAAPVAAQERIVLRLTPPVPLDLIQLGSDTSATRSPGGCMYGHMAADTLVVTSVEPLPPTTGARCQNSISFIGLVFVDAERTTPCELTDGDVALATREGWAILMVMCPRTETVAAVWRRPPPRPQGRRESRT